MVHVPVWGPSVGSVMTQEGGGNNWSAGEHGHNYVHDTIGGVSELSVWRPFPGDLWHAETTHALGANYHLLRTNTLRLKQLLTHRGPVTQYCGGSILCKNPIFFTMKEFPQIEDAVIFLK